ncbi:aldo/keto reductase family protein [Legionella waltersii]|uniref:D-xylose reductase III n=1 Tax=Legionella waltersii TaxID=66969 RepID=A0A0W1A723_9GAMM|nr:aldo/keto reductase [Legionella waltersii]KTD77166.1 D-xylose reductase III [Legionella waltersii]SNV11368.1 D-xylose reductase III [Legionella waltersii]
MMSEFSKSINNLTIPPFLYGTAWKEDQTERVVLQALTSGFTGIDTANQRKHYYEEGVGLAIQTFLKTNQISRSDLFLQTKFTSRNGQDNRLPYDEFDTLTNQVKQSFANSLKHLNTDYIDSYVLHGPTLMQGITSEDMEIWRAMEELVQSKQAKFLGISNVNIKQLETLYNHASIKPTFVQNRCFATTQWDNDVRLFCEEYQLIYQGFSLLTANHPYLIRPYMQSLAAKYAKTIPQITFRFALQIGMLPLTGTTNVKHMQDDLEVGSFELTPDEINHIEQIAVS